MAKNGLSLAHRTMRVPMWGAFVHPYRPTTEVLTDLEVSGFVFFLQRFVLGMCWQLWVMLLTTGPCTRQIEAQDLDTPHRSLEPLEVPQANVDHVTVFHEFLWIRSFFRGHSHGRQQAESHQSLTGLKRPCPNKNGNRVLFFRQFLS
jgi:hypothetical protein